MKYKLASQGIIKLSDAVLSVFNEYRQLEKGDAEAGGTLLGRFILESSDIVIDKVTVPMERDIRKRCYFKRNREDHQKVVYSIWEESRGTCNYLGEWHTHPEPHPTPSSHDLKEWEKVLENTVYDAEELFFLIIGTKSIGVWVGNKASLKIKKLTRC
ncbi:Mov34/MPN/PAD-1 family protein [Domibacillus tundrae]|uniref:Mov34/MPN/PAD-1 family protein n=1 Tax=Domibacillus tundrae TaxID=1587527 RepID=UPI000618004C|nr:Mov34/MPN/PAD-1 family protein [Domibacillus tundrae]